MYKAEEENPKVVLGACLVIRPFSFGAGTLGIESFCGNRKAKVDVGLDLASVRCAVEKAELNRSRSPNIVKVDGAVPCSVFKGRNFCSEPSLI